MPSSLDGYSASGRKRKNIKKLIQNEKEKEKEKNIKGREKERRGGRLHLHLWVLALVDHKNISLPSRKYSSFIGFIIKKEDSFHSLER